MGTCSHTCPCLLTLIQALKVPQHPQGHNGWFVLRDPRMPAPHSLGSACAVTWGRCTLLWPGEGAAGGSFPSICTDTIGGSLPTHPHQLLGNLRSQGQGACKHLLEAGWFLSSQNLLGFPTNLEALRGLILAEAMEAHKQRGQGTCPRSHSKQDWNPSLCVFPIPLTCPSLGHQCHYS